MIRSLPANRAPMDPNLAPERDEIVKKSVNRHELVLGDSHLIGPAKGAGYKSRAGVPHATITRGGAPLAYDLHWRLDSDRLSGTSRCGSSVIGGI